MEFSKVQQGVSTPIYSVFKSVRIQIKSQAKKSSYKYLASQSLTVDKDWSTRLLECHPLVQCHNSATYQCISVRFLVGKLIESMFVNCVKQ